MIVVVVVVADQELLSFHPYSCLMRDLQNHGSLVLHPGSGEPFNVPLKDHGSAMWTLRPLRAELRQESCQNEKRKMTGSMKGSLTEDKASKDSICH